MMLPCLRQLPDGVEVMVLVQPRASRNQIVGLQAGELKVALTAPPVDGAANKACREFFAKLCGRPKSSVRIVSGETSRHKRLLLTDADYQAVASCLKVAGGDVRTGVDKHRQSD